MLQVKKSIIDLDRPLYEYLRNTVWMLRSSIDDLSRFVLEMLRAKTDIWDYLPSTEGYKLLFEKKLNPKPLSIPTKEDNWGIFWIWFISGRLGHTGEDIETYALFGIDPKANSGSILLINSNLEDIDNGALKAVQEIVNAYKSFEESK